MITNERTPVRDQIRDDLRQRRRVLLTSHARPDGDSIGSQMALAYALRLLGKRVRVVNCDPAPAQLQAFPGVETIEIANRVTGGFDAVVVLECSQLNRTGIAGLDGHFIINIDHHPANALYGTLNWFDETAAACAELVYDLVTALGVPLTREIATHLYVAILTDTGAFHHSHVTARTFEICRQIAAADVDPVEVSQLVYQSSSVGKLKLTGALLDAMQIEAGGRLAILYVDDRMLRGTGCAPDDLEGLINLPLTAGDVQAVVFFKIINGTARVSMRSKGAVDVRALAADYGGGGHRNAAGFSIDGALEAVRPVIIDRVKTAIQTALVSTGS
jgi:phosphoesterase RecJ-like protein